MVTATTIEFTRTGYSFILNPRDPWLAQMRLGDGCRYANAVPTHGGNLILGEGQRPHAVDVKQVSIITSCELVDAVVLWVFGSGQLGSAYPNLYIVYRIGEEGLECTGVFASDIDPRRTSFLRMLPALMAAGALDLV